MDPNHQAPSQEELDLLTKVIHEVARGRRLSIEDAEDFSQSVHTRLIESNYDVFQQFAGRSSLRTYLRIVVVRMLLDWRNAMLGKWRPSSAARRLGALAMELERLISRDGHTAHEAIEIVRNRPASPTAMQLMEIIERLPPRYVRRRVGAEAIEQCTVDFDDPLEATEGRRTAIRAKLALRAALQRLAPSDRRLIGLHYRDGHSMRTVAELLQVDVQTVYRRFDRVRRSLRHAVTVVNVG